MGVFPGTDPDELRQRNKQKAEEEAGRGPTRSEPDSVPIGEAIEAFHARGDLVFGYPDISRAAAPSQPERPHRDARHGRAR
jgi:hypothetical protein